MKKFTLTNYRDVEVEVEVDYDYLPYEPMSTGFGAEDPCPESSESIDISGIYLVGCDRDIQGLFDKHTVEEAIIIKHNEE